MACKWYNVCPLRRWESKGFIGQDWAEQYCLSDTNWKNCQRYQMEAENIPHPDNMLPDGSIDGRLKD
jgi:uracil-DNA glycosylase